VPFTVFYGQLGQPIGKSHRIFGIREAFDIHVHDILLCVAPDPVLHEALVIIIF